MRAVTGSAQLGSCWPWVACVTDSRALGRNDRRSSQAAHRHQSIFGILAGLLWILASAGPASVGLVVAISAIGGFIQIVDSHARQAFFSQLVPPADLSSAVSLNGVVMNSAGVVGLLWPGP
jgi:hypothetical protein